MRGKAVITVHPDELHSYANALLAHVLSEIPDLECIVGVRRGGAEVVRAMDRPEHMHLVEVGTARPQTGRKASRLSTAIARRLPTSVADGLRRAEDWMLRRAPLSSSERTIERIPEAVAEIHHLRPSHLLVVDDAVDSGLTLKHVVGVLRASCNFPVEILTAAVTATRVSAERAVDPDFVLFDGTLIRFPWSTDYRPDR